MARRRFLMRLTQIRIFGTVEPVVAATDDDGCEHQDVSIGQLDVPDRNAANHGVLQRPDVRHIGVNQKEPGYRNDSSSKDENLRIDVFHGSSGSSEPRVHSADQNGPTSESNTARTASASSARPCPRPNSRMVSYRQYANAIPLPVPAADR